MAADALAPRPSAADALYANKWLIAFGVTLASVMELIDTSIVNVALADMSANLGVSVDEVTWVTIGYILASVIVLPMTGWLAAYFGRKRYFLWSIVIFTVASFFCGTAGSLESLVIWRIIQGLGGGALIATSQAILFDSFPPRQKTLAAAVFGIGMMVGPALGPTLGGVIVNRYSWPWIFWINLPVGVFALLMVSGFVRDPEYQAKPGRIDATGIGLLAVGIGALQFVLERGEHYDWFDSRLITALTFTAVVALVAMVWWELRVDEPILDLRVLRDRSLAGGSLFAVALGMALYGSVFALPLFMQTVLRYDAETAGWLLLPGAVGSALAMAVIGRFGDRIDLRWVVAAGALVLTSSMVLHSRFTLQTGQGDFFWPVFLRGMGTGMMFVPLASTALAGLRGRDLGQGSAIFNLTRQLGGSAGIAILATELTRQTATQRSLLAEHVSLYNAATQERLAQLTGGMAARGVLPTEARAAALAALDRVVRGQAAVLAYEHIFMLMAFIVLAGIPLIAVLKRPKALQMGGH